MDERVFLQVSKSDKGLGANVAAVWSNAGVCSAVNFEMVF